MALIEDDMLMPHGKGRLSPKLLSVKFGQLLKRLPNESVAPKVLHIGSEGLAMRNQDNTGPIPGVYDAEIAREGRSQGKESPPAPKVPMLTPSDVNLWRLASKMNRGVAPPPGFDDIVEQLTGRRQLFIIDDAKSMKSYLPDIKMVSEAMISLAKRADPDGVELIFTSKPGEVKKKSFFTLKSGTDELVKQIVARFSDNTLPFATNMENKLGTILGRLIKTGNHTSVYVLTDGIWMDSEEPGGGVENSIRTLISSLRYRSRTRDFITIQFVQFGDAQTSRNRLAWLDDELPKSGEDYRHL